MKHNISLYITGIFPISGKGYQSLGAGQLAEIPLYIEFIYL